MKQIKDHLNKAYQYLSKLQVSGDAVDLMAMVRIEMRNAWAAADELEEKERAKNENTDTSLRKRNSEDAAAAV